MGGWRAFEEREEEDYANVSKQLQAYPETEDGKENTSKAGRKRQEDGVK